MCGTPGGYTSWGKRFSPFLCRWGNDSPCLRLFPAREFPPSPCADASQISLFGRCHPLSSVDDASEVGSQHATSAGILPLRDPSLPAGKWECECAFLPTRKPASRVDQSSLRREGSLWEVVMMARAMRWMVINITRRLASLLSSAELG